MSGGGVLQLGALAAAALACGCGEVSEYTVSRPDEWVGAAAASRRCGSRVAERAGKSRLGASSPPGTSCLRVAFGALYAGARMPTAWGSVMRSIAMFRAWATRLADRRCTAWHTLVRQEEAACGVGANNWDSWAGKLYPRAPVRARFGQVLQLSYEAHACAVWRDGRQCWGRNWEGNIGLDDQHPRVERSYPFVGNESDGRSRATGGHNCAFAEVAAVRLGSQQSANGGLGKP